MKQLIIGIVLGLSIGLMLAPFVIPETVAVWLEVVHRICTSIGGLGTFIALIFVIRQFNLLRAQSELVQKNTLALLDGQVYSRFDSFNKFIAENDAEYAMLSGTYDNKQTEKHKIHRLCDLGFTFFEEIFKHHVRYDLLSTEDWEQWRQNMIHFFGKLYVRGYWPTIANRYSKSFQKFVDEKLLNN